jgi:hypothetical protein
MRAVVLSCPHLHRDITALRDQIPDALVQIGLPTPHGHDGCLEMHKTAVRDAQAAQAPAVFVMEDDCQFTPAWDYARWQADAQWAQAHGYDVLVGGSTRTYKPRKVRHGLLEVRAFHSAHCLVYFASGYERVLDAVQPFDLSLGAEVKSEYPTRYVGCRIVLTYPFVAVQRPSFSGILQKPVDYGPEYVGHEQYLRRTLRLAVPA